MRWTPGGVSSDVEDDRGGGGGGGGFRLGGAHIGCGGAVILLVLSLLFRRNFFSLLDNSQTSAPAGQQATTSAVSESPRENKEVQLVSFVLDDVQSTWDKLLPQESGAQYHHAKLRLFRDAEQSACGFAQAASGPFYCPEDEKVYLDLAFFDELQNRFGAPGDFAQAYVIAHEVGHHVQNILGISDKVQRAMQNDPQSANEYSVRIELQADCLAGVWGHAPEHRDLLDPGDVEAGLAAAAAVGDDRLQKMAGRRVNPESWTHGSAAQRMSWFRRGLESGHVSACDTFK